MLVFSLAGIGLASWTGYLGGQIRHTEIGKAPAQDAREGKDND